MLSGTYKVLNTYCIWCGLTQHKATHKLASQVKSQVNDLQVKSQAISLNVKCNSSEPLQLESLTLLDIIQFYMYDLTIFNVATKICVKTWCERPRCDNTCAADASAAMDDNGRSLCVSRPVRTKLLDALCLRVAH